MFFLFMLLLDLAQPAEAKTVVVETAIAAVEDKYICLDATTKFEKEYDIKEHLLSTISNVESGKWDYDLNRRITWPWTINAQGKGMHFDTKEEAIAKVKKLQARGIKSIDVGCMQVNLVFHKDAFDNLEDAFDPYKNVEYAAKFLKKLHTRTKDDWMKAASHYHSKKPVKARRYSRKLNSTYDEVKLSLNVDIFDSEIEQVKRKKSRVIEKKITNKLTFRFD